MRKTADELWAALNAAPVIDTRWKHASGFMVAVNKVALLEEDCDVLVLYWHDGNMWARRLSSFLARFTPAPEEEG